MTSSRVSTDRHKTQQTRQSFGAGRPSASIISGNLIGATTLEGVLAEQAIQNRPIHSIFDNAEFYASELLKLQKPEETTRLSEGLKVFTEEAMPYFETMANALKGDMGTEFDPKDQDYAFERIFGTGGRIKKRLQVTIKGFEELASSDTNQKPEQALAQQKKELSAFLAILKEKIDPVREYERALEAYAHDPKAMEIKARIEKARKFSVNPTDILAPLRALNSYFANPTPQRFSRTEFMKLPTQKQIEGLKELNDAFAQGEEYIRTAR